MDFVLDVNNIECFSKNWGLLLLVNYNISISIQVSSCGWCFGKVEQIELKFLVWHGWYFNSWIKFGCTHFCIDQTFFMWTWSQLWMINQDIRSLYVWSLGWWCIEMENKWWNYMYISYTLGIFFYKKTQCKNARWWDLNMCKWL